MGTNTSQGGTCCQSKSFGAAEAPASRPSSLSLADDARGAVRAAFPVEGVPAPQTLAARDCSTTSATASIGAPPSTPHVIGGTE